MPATDSILRYPGGKTQLTNFVRHLFKINNMYQPVYCEPFCGGAGVALKLLLSNDVESIILNDYDIAIYSIWYAVLYDTDEFLKRVNGAVFSVEEWKRQRLIYKKLENINCYSIELAFASFYLNRTNRSGIITGGPIGGMNQQSKYKLNCRFNKVNLERKIRRISKYREKIYLFHNDGINFVQSILPEYISKNVFIFFDPPYVNKGNILYKNKLTDDYHRRLAAEIENIDLAQWITTYDYSNGIAELYKGSQCFKYKIRYTASKKSREFEYMFANPRTKLESFDKVKLEII